MAVVDDSIKLLAAGSILFGTWGLIDPARLTGLMGDDPELGRQLGIRDTVVGVGLLTIAGPIPLCMRFASDVHDAIRLRDRSPMVALGAAAIALWDAATLVAAVRKGRTLRLQPLR